MFSIKKIRIRQKTYLESYAELLQMLGCFSLSKCLAATWSPPALIDSEDALSSTIYAAFDVRTKECLATWQKNQNHPVYSIYANGNWSAPLPIDSAAQVDPGASVFIASNSVTGEFLAVWPDINSDIPMYSDGNWSPSAPIDSNAYGSSPYVAADPITGRFMAAWTDFDNNIPTYSIYADGNWSLSAPIDSSRIGEVEASDPFISTPFARSSTPFVTFNPKIKGFLATWPEQDTRGTPIYSIYTDGQWSIPTAINTSDDAGSSAEIVSVFDPTTGGFLATWLNYPDGFPNYSIYGSVLPHLVPTGGGLFKQASLNPQKGLF